VKMFVLLSSTAGQESNFPDSDLNEKHMAIYSDITNTICLDAYVHFPPYV